MSKWSGLFAVEVSGHAAAAAVAVAAVGVCLPLSLSSLLSTQPPGILRTHAEASNYPAATAMIYCI